MFRHHHPYKLAPSINNISSMLGAADGGGLGIGDQWDEGTRSMVGDVEHGEALTWE